MRYSLVALTLCLLTTGCKVGPDYEPPHVTLPEEYTEDLPDRTFEIEDEDLVSWWCLFDDPILDQLLETAISDNFDYRIALEQVYQARAEYWIQFTQLLPDFESASTASRFRTSQSFNTTTPTSPTSVSLSPFKNFYQIGLDAIWEIDVFGKFRRSTDASFDLWEASIDELRGVKITVISEVANIYTSICALQQKEGIFQQIVELDKALFDLSETRFDAGLVDEQEMDLALAVMAADEANLASVQGALKQYIYSLAVLLGRLPEDVIEGFRIARPIPHAEGRIPIGLPSDLLRRRPDIRASERQLAAATEDIGVAVGDLYPSFSLTGSSSSFASNPLQGANLGYSSDTLNKLFRPASLIWGIGGFVTAPVFDFGKRMAAVDVQIALRNQAYHSFQKIVVAALQETEQTLATYFAEEKRLAALEKEVSADLRVLKLATDLFQSGLGDYTQVLQAKEAWLIAFDTLIDSQRALTLDLIAIYKTLGGEW